jgi:hypothetical protein
MAPTEFDRHAGPGLDRLFPVHLPDGRLCSVSHFAVLPAYLGILEGGMTERIARQQRDMMLELVRERFLEPVLVLEPERIDRSHPGSPARVRLPWMACAATLVSRPVDPAMLESRLTILWWQDSFEAPLPEEIERAVSKVDWAHCAQDQDDSF